mmetsp:Transcript_67288/g.197537  ORF Transcript_67288/g.197537 Transcript_67288/m.197537 type:complete len:295 (-) Transcript_67288:78-962(-)
MMWHDWVARMAVVRHHHHHQRLGCPPGVGAAAGRVRRMPVPHGSGPIRSPLAPRHGAATEASVAVVTEAGVRAARTTNDHAEASSSGDAAACSSASGARGRSGAAHRRVLGVERILCEGLRLTHGLGVARPPRDRGSPPRLTVEEPANTSPVAVRVAQLLELVETLQGLHAQIQGLNPHHRGRQRRRRRNLSVRGQEGSLPLEPAARCVSGRRRLPLLVDTLQGGSKGDYVGRAAKLSVQGFAKLSQTLHVLSVSCGDGPESGGVRGGFPIAGKAGPHSITRGNVHPWRPGHMS